MEKINSQMTGARAEKLGYWAAVTFALTLVGQLTGFFRELTYAAFFGTSAIFDAFTIVFGFVLFMGALVSAILFIAIPSLTKSYLAENSDDFSQTLTSLVLISFIPVLAIVLLGEMFPWMLLQLIGPGLISNPEMAHTSVKLVQFGLPISLLMCGVHLLRSILNLTGNFFISSLESVLFNLGIILSVFVWVGLFETTSIFAPLIGIYLAYLIYLAWGIATLKLNFSVRWKFDFSSLKKVAYSGGWLVIGTLLAYISPLVLMWHASLLNEGAASAMGYVSRLLVFSLVVFVNSVMAVFLPSAARMIEEANHEKLARQTEKLLKVVLGFALCAGFFILLEGETLVRLIYQHGQFSESNITALSALLTTYLPWMFFFPMSAIAIRVLYAYQDYRAISAIAFFCLLPVLFFTPVMREWFGVNGLGWMSSLHMALYGSALLWVVGRKRIPIAYGGMAVHLVKLFFVLASMTVLAAYIKGLWITESLYIFVSFALLVSIVFIYVNKATLLKARK